MNSYNSSKSARTTTHDLSHRRTGLQSGVGLIEVLVAVLVLSIGFLGIAALQAMSLSTNNSAMARSMATISSYSILDAMRADMNGARSGNYNRTGTGVLKGNACPAASGSLAQAQLHQWCTQLSTSLGPSASTTGGVDCSTVGAGVYCTITITFDDSRSQTGGGNTQKVVTRAML